MQNQLTFWRSFVFFLLVAGYSFNALGQPGQRSFLAKPFSNKVFIEERGQFAQRAVEHGAAFPEKVAFGVENAEFYAYFNKTGITFQFIEYKRVEGFEGEKDEEEVYKVHVEGETEPHKQRFERVWQSVNVKFVDANPFTQIVTGEKVKEYYNYADYKDSAQYNFVPAYKKIKYINLYPGVDAEFELPAEGGIKYQFIVQPGITVPEIAMEFTGINGLALDKSGNLLINSLFGKLTDHAPTAYTAVSNNAVDVKYILNDNRVKFEFPSGPASYSEGLVIDPWITATAFPAANSAFDIQEDAAGNVYVHGSTTNYQVQKYDAAGILLWTYVTSSVFLGDIAVDNPGNVYIIGGYSAGKRQKLDPNGVQQWQLGGLVEEWRLAFDYSKTVLTIGGFFINPAGNNVARFDTSTGAISDQIVYGEETRGIATDCNGDMFSLHVTFGYTGVAASNTLRKTNANFTPGGAVQSGFLLAEAELTTGYAPNPTYGPYIYQGINGLVVMGSYVYAYDGASIRRFDKTSLAFINSTVVPNGSMMMCSGIAADNCGNIYAGSLNGIAQFDSALNFQQTIATPGAVYDLLQSGTGELLVCGAGFIGNFNIVCTTPASLSATTTSGCEGVGTATVVPAGGVGPYTYQWQPTGETTASLNNPPAGTHTYVVSDAFCQTHTGTVVVNATPVASFSGNSTATSNAGTNSVCAEDTIQFTNTSTVSSGTIVSHNWNFGDGSPADVSQNPLHIYASAGTYAVTLIITTNMGCVDTSSATVTVYPVPVAAFSAPSFCPGVQDNFTNQSSISSGTIAGYSWNFGDGTANSSAQNPAHTYAVSNTYNVNLSVTSANGCVHDTTRAVTVGASPQAAFSAAGTCVTAPTVFTDLSTVASPAVISSWAWDVDNNGSTDYATANATHTFSTSGTHNVLLTVVSSEGCVDDTLVPVTVFSAVTADFSTTNVCVGTAAFGDQSTGNIATWNWNFGDGSSNSLQNPSHNYSTEGTYPVQLLVTSAQGCTDSITKQLTIYPVPSVDFSTIPASGCAPLNVVLNDLSSIATGSNVSWSWQAGPGFLSQQQNTGFVFAVVGTYNVTLTVTSDQGCVDSLTKSITVYPNPTVDFATTPANGCAPLNVTLTDLSTISNGSNVGWNWKSGSLFSSAQQNGSYSFTNHGTYDVTLVVTSNQGCIDSLTKSVTVHAVPVVDFSTTPANGCPPLNVLVTDLTTIAAGSNTTWNWQAGSGFSSQQQNAAFNFTIAGTYNVTLTVTSNQGCTDSVTKPITVYPVPTVDFATTPADGCAPLNVTLTDLSSISGGSNVGWNWKSGSLFTVAQQNGSYNFTSHGTYDVSLAVTSDQGCSDSLTKSVTVHPTPIVDFEAVPADGCVPLQVMLNDLSSIAAGNNTSWNWQVENLFASSQQNTSFNFVTDGTYDVTLTVVSDMGCETTLTRSDFIVAYPNPLAEFTANPHQAEILDADIQFADASAGNPVQWNWQFGTGDNSNLQNPSYTYAYIGTFTVMLEVANVHGCNDTATQTVVIFQDSKVFIPNVFTPNGDGNNDTWGPISTNVKFLDLKVFNRIGEKVFETNDINKQWDGTYLGKPVQPGVFVYVCALVDLQNVTRNLKGSVTLIR